MRDLDKVDAIRNTSPAVVKLFGNAGNSRAGCFHLVSPVDGRWMRVIATATGGWDHVSVVRSDRCPDWPEMEHVKRTFFREDETAMQLHVPPGEHVNIHENCLHLWRPQFLNIPRPPQGMV